MPEFIRTKRVTVIGYTVIPGRCALYYSYVINLPGAVLRGYEGRKTATHIVVWIADARSKADAELFTSDIINLHLRGVCW